MQTAFDAIGYKAYAVYIIMEICAEKMEKKPKEELSESDLEFTFNRVYLQNVLRMKRTQTDLVLTLFSELAWFSSEQNDYEVRIKFPMLLNLLDRDMKKTRKLRVQDAQKSRLDEDEDKELDKELELDEDEKKKNIVKIKVNENELEKKETNRDINDATALYNASLSADAQKISSFLENLEIYGFKRNNGLGKIILFYSNYEKFVSRFDAITESRGFKNIRIKEKEKGVTLTNKLLPGEISYIEVVLKKEIGMMQ